MYKNYDSVNGNNNVDGRFFYVIAIVTKDCIPIDHHTIYPIIS